MRSGRKTVRRQLLNYSFRWGIILRMKFEKISENQVRCTLTSFDLSIRNVNIKELTYGSEKAKSLFTEMMQRAGTELGFETEGMPIMVEAIPLKDDSIVLVITKVEEPDELDTRFSRLSPSHTGPMPGSQGIAELAKSFAGPQPPAAVNIPEGNRKSYVFDDLDTAIGAAKAIGGTFVGKNSLYKDLKGKRYILAIENEGEDGASCENACNCLAEYGRLNLQNQMGSAYFREHYETIISDDALERLAEI